MIDAVILAVTEVTMWWFTLWYGILYFVPAVTVFLVYTLRSIDNIKGDRESVKLFNKSMTDWNSLSTDIQKHEPGAKPYYTREHTTIGFIFGRWFLALLPVVNLFPFFFDCLGGVIDACVQFFRRTFNISIIAKPQKD